MREASAIDELLDNCLPTTLGNDGHNVYLLNPATRETVPVVQCASWQEAESERKQIRRILCGIVGAVLQEYLR